MIKIIIKGFECKRNIVGEVFNGIRRINGESTGDQEDHSMLPLYVWKEHKEMCQMFLSLT
jgi:hypothetical protein